MDLPESFPNFSIDPKLLENQNHAKAFYERIVDYIFNFEKELKDNEEVGARLVSFGQELTFHIEDVGYWNPSLITFEGTNEHDKPVKLIQHVTQISVLLTALPRIDMERARIGYTLKNNIEQ